MSARPGPGPFDNLSRQFPAPAIPGLQPAANAISLRARPQAEDVKVEGAFPVTMLPGDGVGPELMHAVKEVFKVSPPGEAAPREGARDRGIVGGRMGSGGADLLHATSPRDLGIRAPPPPPRRLLVSQWSSRSIT